MDGIYLRNSLFQDIAHLMISSDPNHTLECNKIIIINSHLKVPSGPKRRIMETQIFHHAKI
jgi:hypothetical protein